MTPEPNALPAAAEPLTASTRTARILTEVFAPGVLAAVLPLIIGAHAARTIPTGVAWGLLASLFCAVLPLAMIWQGVRRGTLSDRHIGVRSQRTKPLTLGLASVLIGLILLAVLDAPRELIALIIASFTGGVIATAVNHFWKLSVHTSVAAGTAVVLTITFGPWLLLTAVLVAAVAWSRVKLRDHTTAQVLAGIAIGAFIACVLFGSLR